MELVDYDREEAKKIPSSFILSQALNRGPSPTWAVHPLCVHFHP